MKKILISPEQLKEIIELMQLGYKWTEIELETKVERRIAKRAYEEWERDKKMREQQAARFRVASEAFHEHVNDLVTLAKSVGTKLDVLGDMSGMETDAKDFFSRLLQEDLLGRYASSDTTYAYRTIEPDWRGFYYREKELLLEALKTHGGKELREALEHDWEGAKNNCAIIVPQLRENTSELVRSFFSQAPQEDFLERSKEASHHDDLLEQITESVIRVVCRAAVSGELDEEGPWFKAETRQAVTPGDIDTHLMAAVECQIIVTFFGSTNTSLAEEVARTVDRVVSELRKGDKVQELYYEVDNLKKATEKLREMLNPVKLKPTLLNTQCDLCPV